MHRYQEEQRPNHSAPSKPGLIWRLITELLIRWQTAKTRATLESLSDALLKNIGITRGEIPYVAARVAGTIADVRSRRRPQRRRNERKEVAA